LTAGRMKSQVSEGSTVRQRQERTRSSYEKAREAA
jgi:hypothetical protein